ncbi:MAG: 4-hydroxythreonine-4-phosphate dehydrogenase PdxA, partial [Verrucomicrobiota bacterium]
MKPAIALTLGEPAGIGPEVAFLALKQFKRRYKNIDVRLLGDSSLGQPGCPSKKTARSALQALQESARLAKSGEVRAIVNAPVSKEWLQKVGFKFPGQTEFYANAFGLKNEGVTMLMASSKITIALVTTHCSLLAAVRRVTVDRIIVAAERLRSFLVLRGKHSPRIAIAGLNPHAGEAGAFGSEEIKTITPAV